MNQLPIDIVITRVKTGEARWINAYSAGHDELYNWEEGNYSCNCNRADFWEHAGEFVETDDIEAECSAPRAFTVEIFCEGQRIYSEVQ